MYSLYKQKHTVRFSFIRRELASILISVAKHMQFYFFSATGLAALEGSFLLSVKSVIESTS